MTESSILMEHLNGSKVLEYINKEQFIFFWCNLDETCISKKLNYQVKELNKTRGHFIKRIIDHNDLIENEGKIDEY